MSEEHRPGFYKDKFGDWQPDRRGVAERRGVRGRLPMDHERRKQFRRRVDRELLNCDHKGMIEDALEDFAEHHHGHL